MFFVADPHSFIITLISNYIMPFFLQFCWIMTATNQTLAPVTRIKILQAFCRTSLEYMALRLILIEHIWRNIYRHSFLIQFDVFKAVLPLSDVVGYKHFGGWCYLHLHPEDGGSTMTSTIFIAAKTSYFSFLANANV